MKPEKKEKAKKLRKQGLSICKIAKQLDVAKSSVSGWVRSVKLTKKQKEDLFKHREANLALGVKAARKKYKVRRIEYQRKGALAAEQKNELHLMGCMLYWGEGKKSKNSVVLCNTDVNLLIIFRKFLRDCFNVKPERMFAQITCYLGNGKTLEEIQKYWSVKLDIPPARFRKPWIKEKTTSTGFRKNRHTYGICRIGVNCTEIVQSIYGAIQKYANFTNLKWIN